MLAEGSITTGGKPMRVREFTDPSRLGVRPAPPPRRYGHADAPATAERVPVYVPRDLDEELRDTIARNGFVLLVGDSTAGKSRAAFEAITTRLPVHALMAPEELPAALMRRWLIGDACCGLTIWKDISARQLMRISAGFCRIPSGHQPSSPDPCRPVIHPSRTHPRRRPCRRGPRIGDALTHAEAYGIPEYLACGPQFLHVWESGWAKGARLGVAPLL